MNWVVRGLTVFYAAAEFRVDREMERHPVYQLIGWLDFTEGCVRKTQPAMSG